MGRHLPYLMVNIWFNFKKTKVKKIFKLFINMILNENILLEVNRIMEIMGVNDDISITILNEEESKTIESESFENLDYIKVPDEVVSQVYNARDEIYDLGKDYLCIKMKKIIQNNKVKKSCKRKIKIIITDHFLKRLYRLFDYDYMEINPQNKKGKKYNENIVNPKTTEGIDLIKKSLNKIIDIINNSDWSGMERKKDLIISDKKNKYHLALKIEKFDTTTFNISLITQIKGVDVFFVLPFTNPIRINEKKMR